MIEVIIPIYNGEKYIANSFASVINQSLKPALISICDDGSNDHSLVLVNQLGNESLQVFKNNSNLGNLKTVNKLLRKTTCDYIAFQDVDDWSDTDRFNQQLRFMNENNLDFCFTNFIKTNDKGDALLYAMEIGTDVIFNEANVVKLEPYVCFASILFKRRIYEKIGGFDQYFDRIGGADIDWFYRAILAGFEGGIVNQQLYYYRNNATSFTSTVSLNKKKSVSLEIARHFYNIRKVKDDIDFKPSEEEIEILIDKELNKQSYSKKDHLHSFIVQSLEKKRFLISLKYIPIYLSTAPVKLSDLRIFNFFLYKILK